MAGKRPNLGLASANSDLSVFAAMCKAVTVRYTAKMKNLEVGSVNAELSREIKMEKEGVTK